MPVVSRVIAEEGGPWSDTLIWRKDRFSGEGDRDAVGAGGVNWPPTFFPAWATAPSVGLRSSVS